MVDPKETTDDAFLGGALRILQPKAGFRAGMDSLLLAASIDGRGHVLDVGAGVGVVGLAVARRVAEADVVLVERDPDLLELARANIARNGLLERARAIGADIARPLRELGELSARTESFDHVLANPPYYTLGRCTPARGGGKGAAHAMAGGELERWLRFMAAMVKPGGVVSLVHRADALGEVLAASRGRFGGHAILPLHARPAAAASRVLVHAIKGSRAPLRLLAGVILHEDDGRFRAEIEAVLRSGAGLQTVGLAGELEPDGVQALSWEGPPAIGSKV
jgi:tRNA1(Val) A37 N6-methylase TrmN6